MQVALEARQDFNMYPKPEAVFRKPSPLRKRHHENTQLLYLGHKH